MVKKNGVLCYDRESGRYDIYIKAVPAMQAAVIAAVSKVDVIPPGFPVIA